MSSDTVIQVNNISKCFEMYEKPVHRLLQTLCAGRKKFYKAFWALKDISFEVKKGESIGIIGKNGAGKSTLLQIVTRTLQPTTGSVQVNGRVAALLELGSGFNPEFTGRENVFMNAAILGLSESEIQEKFPQILEFADIGDFIDQPIKTYSSGMMVRLAFAVQVLVEPDILIVDEALAVGDAAFQRKCFARMDELKAKGVTLVLVTHDIETVKQRCDRVIFLKDSKVEFDGEAEEGVVRYMHYLFPNEFTLQAAKEKKAIPVTNADGTFGSYVYEKSDFETSRNVWGLGGAFIRTVRIYGLESGSLMRTPGKFKIEVHALWDREFVARKIAEEHLFPNMLIGIRLSDVKNVALYGTNNNLEQVIVDPFAKEQAVITYTIDLPMLKNGDLFLTVAIGIGNRTNHIHLIWDDLAIQLHNISEDKSEAVFYCPTVIREEFQ